MSDGISDMLRGPSDYCAHGRAVEDGESCFSCDAELSRVNLQLLARVAELEASLATLRPIARAAVLEKQVRLAPRAEWLKALNHLDASIDALPPEDRERILREDS